jgi:hypothetical protein
MLLALMAVAVLTPAAGARVWVTARYYDGKTPLEWVDPNYPTVYRGIMVGTHLTIVVSADQIGYWSGSLNLDWDNAPYAVLSGRGPIAKPVNYEGSCLEAAGEQARVMAYMRPYGVGFVLWSTHVYESPVYRAAAPGDWFIFDYFARKAGTCDVALFDPEIDRNVPVQTLSFTHVPSRDFDMDTIVNLKDFAILAAQWRSTPNADPNHPAAAMDFDANRIIDTNDLSLFSDFWLERTAPPKPADDPNAPDTTQQTPGLFAFTSDDP